MNELWADPAFRAVVIIVFVQIVIGAIKKYRVGLEDNKTILRVVVGAVCLIGAVVMDWTPDGVITLDVVWMTFWQSLLGAEVTYQWVTKYIATWNVTVERVDEKKKK